MAQLDHIGHRITAFLDAALDDWQPDREIPEAEAILDDLVAQLPEHDPEWGQGLAAIAAIIGRYLQERPHDWLQALKLIAIYFDDAWIPETRPHQRADRRMRQHHGGIDHHPVPIHLAAPLVKSLLAQATRSQRVALLTAIDSWEVLQALASVLPDLDLTTAEMAHFLHHVDPFTSRDLARREVFDAVFAWAGRHTATAKEIVDTHLRQDAGPRLEISSIQILIEGVMAASADERRWRDEVISKLAARHDEESWQLALLSACFAWPLSSYPRVEIRHEELIRHVERLPERMIPIGLWAARRDAGEFPQASLSTALRLWQLWPPSHRDSQSRANAAALLADVASTAARALAESSSESGTEDAIEWQPVLNILESFVSLEQVRSLDSLLAQLARLDRGLVRTFLSGWLIAHRQEILAVSMTMDRIFPILANQVGYDELSRLLLVLATDHDPTLRRLAVTLLARSASKPQTIAHLCAVLSDIQVCAFIFEIVAQGVPGNFWVPLLFSLARRRADSAQVLETIRIVLESEAAPDYPGLCRQELNDLNDELASAGDEVNDSHERRALQTAYDALVQTLESQEGVHRSKYQVPELRSFRPSAAAWKEALQRRMQAQQEMLRQSGASILYALLPQVPIARGEASIHGADDGVEVPFREYAATVESPIRDLLDPEAMALARLEYRRRAAELLGDEPEAV